MSLRGDIGTDVLSSPGGRPDPPAAPTVLPMDSALTVARLEFAVTASLHFFFVATTLGLAPYVAWVSTRLAVTGASRHRRTLDYVVRLYLVNYGIGIVSGIVMELQLGLNWSGDGSRIYDPVATLLAVETLVAFFVESTLLALWIVSAGRFPEWVRAALLWGVAGTAWASAYVVLSANGFLHRPVGVELAGDGSAHVTDVVALLTNPSAVGAFAHVVGAAAIVSGFWLAAGGARLLALGRDVEVALPLLRGGVLLVGVGAPWTVASGLGQFSVARADLTTSAGAFGLLLAVMMLAGLLITVVTWVLLVPAVLSRRLERWTPVLRVMTWAPWLPLAITVTGWVYREEARQPWFVVGHVTVAEAASFTPLPLLVTATGLTAVAVIATVVDVRLMSRSLDVPPARAGVLA